MFSYARSLEPQQSGLWRWVITGRSPVIAKWLQIYRETPGTYIQRCHTRSPFRSVFGFLFKVLTSDPIRSSPKYYQRYVTVSISKTGKFRHWKVDNTKFYNFWAPSQSNINSTQTWGRPCIRVQDGKPSQLLGYYCIMTAIFSHLIYSHRENWNYYK